MAIGADSNTQTTLRDPFGANPAQADYDAIAELFLGGAAPKSGPDIASHKATESANGRSAPPIEAVILGHLPGVASPWASQYAAAVAERVGAPVGVVRIADHELSIELIGDAACARVSTLAQAAGAMSRMCQRILVRFDDLESSADASTADSIVILTGADEAATVAAYRTIKHIASTSHLGRGLRFRASIMGANDIDAHRSLQHLRQAAATFLDHALESAPGVQRLGPVMRNTIYRAPYTGTMTQLVAELRHSVSTEKDPLPPTSATKTAPQFMESRRIDPTAMAPQPEVDAKPIAAPRSKRLADRVAGLRALESRCPYHGQVELASDTDGSLHLLRRGGVESVGELMAVETWANDHGSLLVKAEPTLRSTQAACLHLFTDQPASLRGLLSSSIRIHVLAEAEADGYVCLPLNHG